ncbi:MAG: V-type ATP synthase subunit A [Thermoplasmata archaeon]|nr:V-type ATP synthase subunit A [Thermoplasmata archaeon]
MSKTGEVYRVAGPVVTAKGIFPKMSDVVLVGNEKLMGEVIKIVGDQSIIQVYEETSGIRPGEPVVDTGESMMLELGPGLLGTVYDGIQRPLSVLMKREGTFIHRGSTADGLDRSVRWPITVTVKPGDILKGGDFIAETKEKNMVHRIMVPPNVSGTVAEVFPGEKTVEEVIVKLTNGVELKPMHKWPVRVPRPVTGRLMPDLPLTTGQRILDTLFPLAKGGTAAIPGGFGTGKTVTQQQLAKWSDADIVIYVGCGERGNEMTEVLTEFPELVDPKTGDSLINRTVLIANTSNMPVAAREASVYTGVTMAEYYRDMGYDVSLMADSTSRWAEAMKEISSRLEEMPGEEGYPAYLSSRLSQFYERGGRSKNLNGTEGSISIIGAVSPAGGDFSEPVTQNTLRIVKVFWALDTKLRERRHFPAINWLTSYSLYSKTLETWYQDNVDPEWKSLREWTMTLLQKEAELLEIAQLVGSDAMPKEQRLTLEMARMVREIFLQQNAFHEVDTFSSMKRQFALLNCIKIYSDAASEALARNVSLQDIASLPVRTELTRAKFEKNMDEILASVATRIRPDMEKLKEAAI